MTRPPSLPSFAWLLALALLVPAVGPAPAVADDPQAAVDAWDPDGQMPPELDRGKDAFLAPADRPDLIEYIGKLRRAIEAYETPPPSTERITALKDAWNAILRPRARRMTKRLEKWENPKRWIYERGDPKPLALQPDQWPQFTRDMAALATELHGAWKQYGTVKVNPKEYGFGQTYLPKPPRVGRFGYPWPTLYGSILDRQGAGASLGRWSSHSYWNLMNRFSYAWDWRYQQRMLWYDHWRKRAKATKQMFKDVRAELDATRESLGENMLGLQVLVAALQNVEEERLVNECVSCRTRDPTLVEMADTALDAMQKGRLEAERYQGRSSAGYGSVLRKWLRAQKASVKVLEIAKEQDAEIGDPVSTEDK